MWWFLYRGDLGYVTHIGATLVEFDHALAQENPTRYCRCFDSRKAAHVYLKDHGARFGARHFYIVSL